MVPYKQSKLNQERRWDLPAGSVVWVYLRHSPGDVQTIDSQREGMREWCAEHQWMIDRFWVDEGISGSREDRDEFQAMMSAARQTPCLVDGIVVWSFSRFARSQLDAQFYKAELRKRGYVVQSKIDDVPDNEMAGIYEAFIDWKNERFLKDLAADVQRGQGYVARQGFWVVGPPPTGYRVEKVSFGVRRNGQQRYGNRLVKDEAVADRVALAWRMKIERNAGYQEIHEATGLYERGNKFYRFFDNLIYAGIYVYRGQWLPEHWADGERFCEPYITLEEYQQVQVGRHARRQIHPRVISSQFLLSGLMKCGPCREDGRVSSVSGSQNANYPGRAYRCTYRHQVSRDCALPRIKARVIEPMVLEVIKQQVFTSEYFRQAYEQMMQDTQTSRLELEQQYHAAEVAVQESRQALDAIITLISKKGLNEALERRYDESEQTWRQMTTRLNGLKERLEHEVTEQTCFDDLMARVDIWISTLDGSSLSQKQELLRSLIDEIVVYPDHLDIHFRFTPEVLTSRSYAVPFEPQYFCSGRHGIFKRGSKQAQNEPVNGIDKEYRT
jgi:site-specific DNA recombinase